MPQGFLKKGACYLVCRKSHHIDEVTKAVNKSTFWLKKKRFICRLIWQAASLNQKPFDEGVPKPPWVVLPSPYNTPLSSFCLCSSWPEWQIERKTLVLLPSQARPLLISITGSKRKRLNSQSDEPSRCVGWGQPSIEINLLTQRLLLCLTEK